MWIQRRRGEWVVAIYMYLRLSYHTILGNKVKQVKKLINLHFSIFFIDFNCNLISGIYLSVKVGLAIPYDFNSLFNWPSFSD